MEAATASKSVRLMIVFDPAPGLKDAIDADAAGQERSINDLIVEIVGRSFDLTFPPSGRSSSGSKGGSSNLARLPRELYAAIKTASSNSNLNGGPHQSMQEIILRRLCSHYEIAYGR